MRTDDFRPSDNVEDDREASASRGGMSVGAGGLGIGTVIIIGLISWYLGIDPSVLLNGAQILTGGDSRRSKVRHRRSLPEPRAIQQESLCPGARRHRGSLDRNLFRQRKNLPPAEAALFAGSEPTPCAFARSAMGPFYCPRDQRIYLDTAFFDDLQNKFGGCTDSNACKFSEAYVIAHEVGHHVQDELGILPRVMQAQQASTSKAESNALQVRVELQADCLAGIWANRSQQKNNFLDPGDVDQALQTASAIGDDRLQKETQGYVVPDAFTHGTSAQRKRWFMNGFNSGQLSACDTFSAQSL